MENFQLNLQETLSYVNRLVPQFDPKNLLTRAPLDGELNEWDAILSRTASHTILRSGLLRTVAQRVYAGMLTTPSPAWERELVLFQAHRRELLAGRALLSQHPELNWQEEIERPGAFVIFQPEATLSDGAAWVASNGYLDVHNCTPWDTWVMTIPCPDGQEWSGLLCWVPDWARELVEAGITVNPENCIFWADMQEGQILWRRRPS